MRVDAALVFCATAYLVGGLAVAFSLTHFGVAAIILTPLVFVVATLEYVYLGLGAWERLQPTFARVHGGGEA